MGVAVPGNPADRRAVGVKRSSDGIIQPLVGVIVCGGLLWFVRSRWFAIPVVWMTAGTVIASALLVSLMWYLIRTRHHARSPRGEPFRRAGRVRAWGVLAVCASFLLAVLCIATFPQSGKTPIWQDVLITSAFIVIVVVLPFTAIFLFWKSDHLKTRPGEGPPRGKHAAPTPAESMAAAWAERRSRRSRSAQEHADRPAEQG